MDREGRLEAVRDLTHPVIALLAPSQSASFDLDFAAWSAEAGLPRTAERAEAWGEGPGLDTTLVAGMFFQVLLEAEQLPAAIPERVSFVRRAAKNFLVTRLAGQITLSQFFRLLSLIEVKVQTYFESLGRDWLEHRPATWAETLAPARAALPGTGALAAALAELDLPARGRRVHPLGLEEFLNGTRGTWFRVLDFEAHFGVNKKTAWLYLKHLLQGGILRHNGGRANRARYALAPPFL